MERCRVSCRCANCGRSASLANLSANPEGYLRPVRCKSCGQAARPTPATCDACAPPWKTCKSRPVPGANSVLGHAVREAQQWVAPFAMDDGCRTPDDG